MAPPEDLGLLRAAVRAPQTIFRTGPPYGRLEALRELPRDGLAGIEMGSVLLVGVPDAPSDWWTVAERIQRLRSSYPAVAVGVLLPPDADPGVLNGVSGAGFPRVRAVLCSGEPVAATLRDRMTRPEGLGTEVTDWLGLRGVPFRPRMAAAARDIIDGSDRPLGELIDELKISERTLRRHFAGSGLPPPGEWHAVGRALHAVLRLQRELGTPLLRIALEAEYGDHSSLSRQIKRLFGRRPGEIRRALGWEWVLERWVGRWMTRVRKH